MFWGKQRSNLSSLRLSCAAVCVVSCWWCPVASLAPCWCRVLLRVVAGCPLLGLVPHCCFPLGCFIAGAPAWPRGLLPCSVLWFVVASRSPVLCPVFCGAVLPCAALPWCPAVHFAFLVVLVCVLSLCLRCCVALCVVLFGAGWPCAVVGASRCGVSLCVVLSPLAFCGLVVLTCCVVWCALVACCAVLCPLVPCCLAVPCCWALLCVPLCCGWSFLLSLLSGVLVRCPMVSRALCCVLRCCAALWWCAGGLCCAVVCAAGFCLSFLSSTPLLKTPAASP